MKIRSIRFKINAAISVTCLMIAVIFGAVLYPFEIRRHESDIGKIELLLETLCRQEYNDLAENLSAGEKTALAKTVDGLLQVEGILAVSVVTPEGEPVLATDPAIHAHFGNTQRSLSGFVMSSRHGKSVGIFTKKIEIARQNIGNIDIFYDFEELEREKRLATVIFFMLLSITLIVISVLLNVMLSKFVIKPVSLLHDAIIELREGRLGETVRLPFKDEIGEMGDAFNTMSVELLESRVAAKKAEEKYRIIFENAIEGVFQSTPGSGRYLTVNPSMAAILGYGSSAELVSSVTDIAGQLYVRSKDRESFTRILREDGRILGFETQLHKKDGEAIWVSINARCVFDDEENPVYYEGAFLDITERKRRETAERKREAAEAANLSKSTFLANMSHELRTPLNAILGFAQLMTRDPVLARHRESLDIINRSGEHLLTLINGVLDISKIEAGRTVLEPVGFDLHGMLSGLGEMLLIRAEKKGLCFTVDCQPGLPRHVRSDENKLRQVLLNLAVNAVKFTDSGSVTLRAGPEPKTDVGFPEKIRFEVEDTGVGIAPENIERIFQPFVQIAGQQTAGEGAGLGMAISHQFVRLMGGRISVRSAVGKGSLFAFAIPAEPADLSAIRTSHNTRRVVGLASGQPAYRILVVEDQKLSRILLGKLLRLVGFDVRDAANGTEAIALCDRHRPHLIWMDMRMPGMDGYETARRIRDKGHESKIIALTASVFEEKRKQTLASGFDDFVRKPFKERELFETMRKHLGVDYVYEKNETVSDDDTGPGNRQGDLPPALDALSPEYVTELEHAVTTASQDQIEAIIGKIRMLNPPLADWLEKRADSFEYEKIMEEIRQHRKKSGGATG